MYIFIQNYAEYDYTNETALRHIGCNLKNIWQCAVECKKAKCKLDRICIKVVLVALGFRLNVFQRIQCRKGLPRIFNTI